jgi:uncharacterized protein GlcG (DUF336 family)
MPRLASLLPKATILLLTAGWFALPFGAHAQAVNCPVTHDELAKALKGSVKASGGPDNGGMPTNNEWGAVVNRDGIVCAIAYTGSKPTDQWLGSRAIAVEKANTVNAFGLDDFAISTANLWAQSQPGEPLYGAANSNPPVAQALYDGNPKEWGSTHDPLLGKAVGGVVDFGGGLALYKNKKLIGGLGASGNTACADHNIAWRVREKIGMGEIPNGPTSEHNDAIVYDVVNGKSQSGWGHPTCGQHAPDIAKKIGAGITVSQVQEPTGPRSVENDQPVPPPKDQQHPSTTGSEPSPNSHK